MSFISFWKDLLSQFMILFPSELSPLRRQFRWYFLSAEYVNAWQCWMGVTGRLVKIIKFCWLSIYIYWHCCDFSRNLKSFDALETSFIEFMTQRMTKNMQKCLLRQFIAEYINTQHNLSSIEFIHISTTNNNNSKRNKLPHQDEQQIIFRSCFHR